jgi:hypothetical protein
MEKGRYVICDVCKKEIEVRWGIFANETLSRHKKAEHR